MTQANSVSIAPVCVSQGTEKIKMTLGSAQTAHHPLVMVEARRLSLSVSKSGQVVEDPGDLGLVSADSALELLYTCSLCCISTHKS